VRSLKLCGTMENNTKFFLIKLIHTLIWIFYVLIIFYIIYCGAANKINYYTWIAIGLVIIEGIILYIFKLFCPLTLIARKYSDSDKENFDIFLPIWIARNNKLIFTSIYLIGLFLVSYRVFR
jgi:hypothetical protein